MSVEYAIEIETGYPVTDATFACIDGAFRFITGAPGYLGVPPYPTWENFTNNLYHWYEGFIIKDGLSNPVRQVDLTVSGDYGVLSGFNFVIKNTDKFWNFVKTNNIFLTNKKIKFYVVLNGIFYNVWQGAISNNPMDELNYQFVCTDEFRKIHKNFPPNVITSTTSGVDQSKAVPVAFGDIPYAKLMKIEDISENFDILSINGGIDSYVAAASEYSSTSAGNYLYLITQGKIFGSNDLKGHYLVAISGTSAETDRIIKIKSSGPTIKADGHWYYYTLLTLEDALSLTTTATFQSTYKYDLAGEGTGSNADTWWFKTFELKVITQASTDSSFTYYKKDNQIQLWSWNKDTLKFDDIKDLISINPVTGELALLTNAVNDDGQVVVATKIPITIDTARGDQVYIFYTWGSAGAVSVSATPTEIGYMTDMTREFQFSQSINLDKNWAVTFGSIFVTKKIFETADIKDYDNIYVGMDLQIKCHRPFTTWCKIQVKDCYGKYNAAFEQTEQIYKTSDFSSLTNLNFLSNEYYRSSNFTYETNNDPDSAFGLTVDIGGDTIVYDQLALTDDLVSGLKSGMFSEVYIKIWISYTGLAGGVYIPATFAVKEIGFIGTRKVDTVKGDVFSRIKGELTHTEETNNVYNTFRHILEDYDGLTDAEINYGNIATTRNLWHVGRQVLDRKTSFEYLQELCKHSFVALFPSRTGTRKLVAWRDLTTEYPPTHDQINVIRGSVKNWSKTNIQDVLNTFNLKYNFNPSSSEYDRTMFVNKIEEDAFPLESSNWTDYVGGLDSYLDAKIIWDLCHQSYLRANVVSANKETELPWYIDVCVFTDDAAYNIYKGTKSSAYLLLKNLVEWTSRQKDLVTYNLSLWNISLELCDVVNFNDPIYTNSIDRKGYISKIELDTKKDQLVITTMLEPTDIGSVGDDTITENGSQADTITETGSSTDTITEG